MKKYKDGVMNGHLPLIFLYTIEENKDSNHELRNSTAFHSKSYNNNISIQLSERVLLENSDNYDLYYKRDS